MHGGHAPRPADQAHLLPADPPAFRSSAAGQPRSTLRGPRFRRETRDVYVLAERAACLQLACQALLLALPDAVVSHVTAARLLGLPVDAPAETALPVHLTRPPGCSPVRRPGVVAHVRGLSAGDVVSRHGLRLTAAPRVFLDLAEDLTLVPLVVLGDAVAGLAGVAALDNAVARAAGRRGVARAREAYRHVDPGAESPGETRTRLLLHEAGLPALRHGVRVLVEDGQWLCTPDLADAVARVAVQYDGLVHLHRGPRRCRPTSTATSWRGRRGGRSSA